MIKLFALRPVNLFVIFVALCQHFTHAFTPHLENSYHNDSYDQSNILTKRSPVKAIRPHQITIVAPSKSSRDFGQTRLHSSYNPVLGNEQYGSAGGQVGKVSNLFPSPDPTSLNKRTEKRNVLLQWALHLLKLTFSLWRDFRLGASTLDLPVTSNTLSKVLERQRKPKSAQIHLVDISWLKAHEEVVSQERVANLRDAVLDWEEYRLPLLVDIRTGAILDGHHRYAVGRELGLSRLPVVLVDYLHDDTITVNVWPGCGIESLTKEDVVNMSLSNEVFPPKTSRHDFVSSMSPISVPLRSLS